MKNSITMHCNIGKGNGEMSSERFKAEVDALGKVDEFSLLINSRGGSVMEGIAIASLVANHPAKVTAIIQGGALSITSYIVMRCDRVLMDRDAWLMIHNPMIGSNGDAWDVHDLARAQSQMEKFTKQMILAYAARSNDTPGDVKAMMQAETWLDSTEAIERGYCDGLWSPESTDVKAEFQESFFEGVASAFSMFHNVPEAVASASLNRKKETQKMSQATIADIKAKCKGAPAQFILDQVEAKATIEDAVAAYNLELVKAADDLEKELEALRAENDELKKKVEEMEAAAAEGDEDEPIKPDAEGDEDETDDEDETATAKAKGGKVSGAKAVKQPRAGNNVATAMARWHAAIKEAKAEVASGSMSEAISLANSRNPGLRKEMLDEVNNTYA